MSSAKVYIETYGCSSNQMDSQIMGGTLKLKGYSLVEDAEKADIVILNLCSVKQKTENKERHRIEELRKSGKKLVLAGCLPEAVNLGKDYPETSQIGTNRVAEIETVVSDTLNGQRTVLLGKSKMPKVLMPKIQNGTIRIMEVQSGCGYFCSFCSTKFAKGGQYPYPSRDIVKEIELSLAEGVREFWITGQEVAGYSDNGILLPDLINKITRIEGNFFLRIGMLHPASVLPILNELIESYKNGKVFKFLHLPQQSGSDSMLGKMNRKNRTEDYKFIVKKFRESFPEVTVWTDIIVGHPGETDEEFAETVRFVEETKPDFVNISAYGWRPNTPAAGMKQVPSDVKKYRTRSLTTIVKKLMLEGNNKWLGWKGNVLVDEYKLGKGTWLGRNYAYKPVVLTGEHKAGDFADVEIKQAKETHLEGIYSRSDK
ncbi:MAG TPA: tRNA (N(6)-L-threonylcarbamoyladenosine(37)-C(2))-methylthiotransferase [archaeon]|nr:tRNA (N(6)-L-threonylcarbamoyladenosine(37)-C(2))-methylthiotransferase [archaeon]